ncbi:hypothetical protein GYMLUDRAFT_785159 [Collybiopsis luxurians FD-317 M1]|nr:hypothetical protein GYMLUDRAFT_785159 [Collybiopsis luxurians FD-317 M1]
MPPASLCRRWALQKIPKPHPFSLLPNSPNLKLPQPHTSLETPPPLLPNPVVPKLSQRHPSRRNLLHTLDSLPSLSDPVTDIAPFTRKAKVDLASLYEWLRISLLVYVNTIQMTPAACLEEIQGT